MEEREACEWAPTVEEAALGLGPEAPADTGGARLHHPQHLLVRPRLRRNLHRRRRRASPTGRLMLDGPASETSRPRTRSVLFDRLEVNGLDRRAG
jgi:hypothetical protein